MKYYLHAEGRGEGCDYTIDCNVAVVALKADDREAAKVEAVMWLEDRSPWSHGDGERFKRATLLEVNEAIDLAPELRALVEAAKKEHAEEQLAQKRKQIERLQRELGDTK